jgi:hypothetical protein
MKTMCDVIADLAPFAEPEVVHFPGAGNAVRVCVLPILHGLVVVFENQWIIRYVQLDVATGEPLVPQPSWPPVPIALPGASPRQVGINLTYELVEKLGMFSENGDLPARYRTYATEAIRRINERMSSGPPLV